MARGEREFSILMPKKAAGGGLELGRKKRLTVKVLEVCHLDSLAHAEYICCGAKAIEKHPYISCVEC